MALRSDQFGIPILDAVTIGGVEIPSDALPNGLVLHGTVGIAASPAVHSQIIHRARWPERGLYETRATITPGGDYLLMFPDGGHYGSSQEKVNNMLAYRSSDRGKTWRGPAVAFDIDYNQHGFVPLLPRGSKRIYAFGTQPIPGLYTREHGQQENAPIGYRHSDDDGRSWSEARIIRPKNDPDFRGMSVQRMCETDAGTWLIGSHEGDWSYKPLITRQYILRSEDQGKTWEVLPHRRHGGWHAPGFGRMDELRPISLGGGKVLALARTPEGHIWELRSEDDGKTWSEPKPTSLVHPDAPTMLFHLSDGRTLAAFHHNRHSQTHYVGLTAKMEGQKDRSEVWVSLSDDEGRTWSEPRFVFANALAPSFDNAWRNYNCSYIDMFVDEGIVHLFVPHRWERVLHLRFSESDIGRFLTRQDLCRR
ncbi:MAG: sialidase family protein [Planctomycetota bacterium]